MSTITAWFRRFQKHLFSLLLNEDNISSLLSHKSHHCILLVLFFAVIILPTMAFSSWLAGNIERSFVLLIVFALCLIVLILEKRNKQIPFIKELLVFTIVLLALYLMIGGGLNETGALWCYPLSIILYMFYGAKIGITLNMLLVFIATLIFMLNPLGVVIADYSYTQQTRFIFTFILLNIFVFIIIYAEELLVQSLNQARKALQKASLTDELTGLGNRRFIKEALQSIDRREGYTGELVVVMLIDIDKFKDVNDLYGHDIGDLALVHISSSIKQKIRRTDLIARWGGEEFLVALTNTDLQKAKEIAKNLCKHIQQTPATFNNIELNMSISIGISSFVGEQIDIEKIIKQADVNLYKAKSAGRNRVVY